MSPEIVEVLAEVADERKKQDQKWGEQNHSPVNWLPILAEEFGEVAKEVCELQFKRTDTKNYRAELVQTAAVAVAMIESLDRGNS